MRELKSDADLVPSVQPQGSGDMGYGEDIANSDIPESDMVSDLPSSDVGLIDETANGSSSTD